MQHKCVKVPSALEYKLCREYRLLRCILLRFTTLQKFIFCHQKSAKVLNAQHTHMKCLFQEDLCMSALADTHILFISMCEVSYANVCCNAVFHQSQYAIATISINEKQQTMSLLSFRYKGSLRV